MKLSDALSTFDAYSLRARIYPALIVALPLAALSVLPTGGPPVAALGPLLLSAGILFLVANIVRSLGRRAERRLAARWDGLPTTRMLRFRQEQNQVLFERRRRALESLTGEALPTRRQEKADQKRTDYAYEAAARRLIVHARAQPGRFPLLDHENATYGFARNLLGLKPVALTVLAAAWATDAVLLWRSGASAPLFVVALLHLGLTAVWLLFVRAAWVDQAGIAYAERLFEVLDQPVGSVGEPES